MLKNLKYFNKIQIISNIALFIVLIITLIVQNQRIFHLYWAIFGIAFLGNILCINKWSKEGKTWYKNADKNWLKNLTRKPSDTLLLVVVIFTLIVCSIFIIGFFINNIIINNIVIIFYFILTIIFEYVIYLIINRTFKEVEGLISTNKKLY